MFKSSTVTQFFPIFLTFIFLTIGAPTPAPVQGQCDDQNHCYGFGDHPAPSPVPPPPPPPNRDPNDGANEECAPDRITTKVILNSWQINYGNANPWDMITAISKPGGPCDEEQGQCTQDESQPQETKVIPGDYSEFDVCTQCHILPHILDYLVTFEVVGSAVKTADDIRHYVSAMQVALQKANNGRPAANDRLPPLDRDDNPNGIAQNFAPNYISIERWDGSNPCGKLSVKAKTKPKSPLAASFENAGLSGELCYMISNSLLAIGTALSTISPIGVGITFFGVVTSYCHTVSH